LAQECSIDSAASDNKPDQDEQNFTAQQKSRPYMTFVKANKRTASIFPSAESAHSDDLGD